MERPKFKRSQPVLVMIAVLWLIPSSQQEGHSPSRIREALAPEAFDPGSLNPDAPEETEQLGQLIGVWEATKSIRNRDGTWPSPAVDAEWRWYYILDGHAIQDDWIGLSYSKNGTEIRESIGTNIRIYNPGEKQWYMAWIDKNNRRLASFTATYHEDQIIMTGQNAKGQQIKNTFYSIGNDDFDWKQEWTRDGGDSWFEVVRIHCRRRR